MAKLPDSHIFHSTSIINVSIIDTCATLKGLKTDMFVEPNIPGHEYLTTPCLSFLIQHPTQSRSFIFDLGLKKDCKSWPKPLYEYIRGIGLTPIVPRDIHQFLTEQGVITKKIEGVIWTHSHFNHIGDISAFEPHTKIFVGISTKELFFHGYPTKLAAPFNESDFCHDVGEIDLSSSFERFGGFPAVNYFGDGSFYLLHTPGHYFGHMCGFAIITSGPDSFTLMSGDTVLSGIRVQSE